LLIRISSRKISPVKYQVPLANKSVEQARDVEGKRKSAKEGRGGHDCVGELELPRERKRPQRFGGENLSQCVKRKKASETLSGLKEGVKRFQRPSQHINARL